ncbi:MAG: DNA replication/repair protein RecF [Acholeplasmatales bacterium]|nr:DNA replication/repair protein RecF [Acholeplasmatales bacterium]
MIKSIELKNIRIFKDISFNFNKNIVIFIGMNAIGKTTLLESIYFSCMLKSPKTNNDSDLISFNNDYGIIKVKKNKEYKIVLSTDKKLYIDNKEVKNFKDYIGLNNVVMFSPNDLDLVYGSPSVRRHFLDINICQISKNYLNNLNEYKKVLKLRNDILKSENIDKVLLEVTTKNLIKIAKEIIKFRYEFVKELNDNLVNISKEKIVIEYTPSSSYKNIEEDFKKSLDLDIFNKLTNKGPHRDDIKFIIDSNKSNYASQGQVRSIVLSLKLTLIEIIKKYKKNKPIILLDDVLSELDDERKNKLFLMLNDDYQIFISTTELTNIRSDLLEKAQIIKLVKE